jgi:hypothetical protein
MAREIGELSAVRVAKERTPGVYSDGGGLYLNINPNGARSWLFRYSSPTIKQSGLTAGRTNGLMIWHRAALGVMMRRARFEMTEAANWDGLFYFKRFDAVLVGMI